MQRNLSADIDKLIQNLDITAAMYLKAKQKYDGISAYFTRKGIVASFYPQGSFRLGTVIRPLRRGIDDVYDLDIVGELCLRRDHPGLTAGLVKNDFGKHLNEEAEYSRVLLPEDKRCWTLLYQNDGFALDIVPAAQETAEYMDSLIATYNVEPRFAENAIAITDKLSDNNYIFCTSNPRGYALWFDEINEPYLLLSRETHRKVILNESKGLFASTEEIPDILDRSALQRVIQILKRHRDVYFSNASKGNAKIWDYKPSSVIITTLCAQIASNSSPTGDILELLHTIVSELKQHSKLQRQDSSLLFEIEHKRAYIRKNAQKWSIKNPVNPGDDYTDGWTAENAEWFFRWVDAVIDDLFVQLGSNERLHYSALKSAFGKEYVETVIPESKQPFIPKISVGTQPYYRRIQ